MDFASNLVTMLRRSLSLFSELPEGFLYHPGFLTAEEETGLLREFERLDFAPFDFHGYIARRRIIEYGWEYDFGTRQASATQPLPDFLLPFRDRAAAFADAAPEALVEVVVIQYPPGAPIGWHRDAPQFGIVVGMSLASSCRMRLKPYKGGGRTVSVILEPRSIYLMRDAARWKYQHSIPAVEKLRYSITFRTLRTEEERRAA